MTRLAPSPVRKFSVEIGAAARHRVAQLGPEFLFQTDTGVEWLVEEIDAARTHRNRSSALRLYALRWAKARS